MVLSLSSVCDPAHSVTSQLPRCVICLKSECDFEYILQEAHKSLILVKGQTKNCGKELVDNIKYDEEVFILCPLFRKDNPLVPVKANSNALHHCFCPLLLSRFECIFVSTSPALFDT